MLDPAAGVVMTPGGFRTEIPNADERRAAAGLGADRCRRRRDRRRHWCACPSTAPSPRSPMSPGDGVAGSARVAARAAPTAPGRDPAPSSGSAPGRRTMSRRRSTTPRRLDEPRLPREPRRDHPQRCRQRRRLDGQREPAARRQLERPDAARGRDRERRGLDAGDRRVDPSRAQRGEHPADRGGRLLRRAAGRLRPAAGDRQRQRPGRRCPGRRRWRRAQPVDRHRPADLRRRVPADRRGGGGLRVGDLRVRGRRRPRGQGHGDRHSRRARGRRQRSARAEAQDLAHGRDRRHGLVQHPPGLDRPRRRRHLPQGGRGRCRATRSTSAPTASSPTRRQRACRGARTSRSPSPTASAR